MLTQVRRLISEESGQGMVEYGLILALVAIVVVGLLSAMGDEIKATFSNIIEKLGGTPPTE